MTRKAMKDFTFSDGTTIPAGNIISVAAPCMQIDPVRILRHSLYHTVHDVRTQEYYPDPETFDGFRFHKMRQQEGGSSKHLLASLDLDYVLFGHGRHAWYENLCP